MLYFSIRPCLKRLSLEEKGALFEGILDYAQHGVWPDFDGVLGIAWDFISPLIDADGESYKNKCEQAKRAVESRWARNKCDTDVYDSMRTNTENTNINSSSNTISIPVSIPNTKEGEGRAEEDVFCQMKKPTQDSQDDLEKRQQHALEMFRDYFGKATKQQVIDYAIKNNRTEDEATSFFEYYSARNWMCHGKPIDDWRNLFGSWQCKKETQKKGTSKTGNTAKAWPSMGDVPLSGIPLQFDSEEEYWAWRNQ